MKFESAKKQISARTCGLVDEFILKDIRGNVVQISDAYNLISSLDLLNGLAKFARSHNCGTRLCPVSILSLDSASQVPR